VPRADDISVPPDVPFQPRPRTPVGEFMYNQSSSRPDRSFHRSLDPHAIAVASV
jgi:hypothetical protein